MAEHQLSWTEKYRPTSLSEVQGNPSAIRELKRWAKGWTEGRPDKPGAILVGEAGIGKTSAAHAVAGEMGWSVIELNASDARTKAVIEKVVTRGAVSRGFSPTGEYEKDLSKSRKLIILDEADNVFGRQDRGGMQQIVKTLRETQQPIVLTANDAYALKRKASALRGLCVEIEFKRVQDSTVAKILGNILRAEGLRADLQAVEELASHAGGDVRAAVTDLEALVRAKDGDTLTMEDVETLGYRDARSSIFDALGTILGTMDMDEARKVTRELDEDPESLLLWVEENAPREYTDPEDRARAMAIIARADEFLGATRRTQYYRFWAVASDLMTGGVAMAKRQKYRGWTRYQFPTWLRKMSRSKAQRSLRDGLGAKVGAEYHAGTATAREHIIPAMSFVAQRHEPFAEHLARVLELSEDELALLLDTKASTKKVQRILEAAQEDEIEDEIVEVEARDEEPSEPQVAAGEGGDQEAGDEEDVEEDDPGEDQGDQPSLFDF